MKNAQARIKTLILCITLLLTPILYAQDMDLPIQPPKLKTEAETPLEFPPEQEDSETEDDPRDTPPPVIYGEEIDTQSDTIVFVLDRSFSMNNGAGWFINLNGEKAYGTRLAIAQSELSRSISNLSANFRFNVVSYACQIIQWQDDLKPANDFNKTSALDWIRRLHAVGGTATGPATALGLSFQENTTVVLLTDGAPNCGATGHDGHLTMILSANTQNARIMVFAISPTRNRFRAFCKSVASTSGGRYIEIP